MSAVDAFEGSHLEAWAIENFVSANERRWFAYVDIIEGLIGHDLDGDEGDGFHLDGAYDAFRDDLTAAEYVDGVRRAKAVLA